MKWFEAIKNRYTYLFDLTPAVDLSAGKDALTNRGSP